MTRVTTGSAAGTRMNREQFYSVLATFDEARLKKALWNLYWRSSASVRERIEAELDPDGRDPRKRLSKAPVDAEQVLAEVREFVALARSGAYLAGDRRVSPRERTRWRFTFHHLVADAGDALLTEDVGAGAAAVEELIDLAAEMRGDDYFHSEDPVEAAGFVVSDTVALLWGRLRDHYGFPTFAERAAPQLIRWESLYGWTRTGWGRVSELETTLATVLTRMLQVPDMWVRFVDQYLDALDRVTRVEVAQPRRPWRPGGWDIKERTSALAEWHHLLFRRLVGSDAEDRLDRLTRHRALGGPELWLLQARLAHYRGDVSGARKLVHEGLRRLPGHQDLLGFAAEIGAPFPPGARPTSDARSR